MAILVSPVIDQLARELDDPGLVHHAETVMLALSEAQRLVSWRFRLLRETAPLHLDTFLPLHRVHLAHPRCLWVLYASLNGETLWPVVAHQLRLTDPAWPATTGTPTYFYREGLTHVGFYPVPEEAVTIDLTMLVAPRQLRDVGQFMEVPDTYLARVVDVATGILLITGERAFEQGMARVKTGLDLPQRPRLTERHARDKQD